MRSTLAAVAGILTVALATGIGAVTLHTNTVDHSHQVVANGTGPG